MTKGGYTGSENHGQHDEYPCPKCGEETGNLPRHIRFCDGDNDE